MPIMMFEVSLVTIDPGDTLLGEEQREVCRTEHFSQWIHTYQNHQYNRDIVDGLTEDIGS